MKQVNLSDEIINQIFSKSDTSSLKQVWNLVDNKTSILKSYCNSTCLMNKNIRWTDFIVTEVILDENIDIEPFKEGFLINSCESDNLNNFMYLFNICSNRIRKWKYHWLSYITICNSIEILKFLIDQNIYSIEDINQRLSEVYSDELNDTFQYLIDCGGNASLSIERSHTVEIGDIVVLH